MTIPLGVFLGYYLVAKYIERVPFNPSPEVPNITGLLRKRHPNFYTAFTLVSLATYILIIAFELYTSATIIGAVLFPAENGSFTLPLAALFLILVLSYTIVGGQRSAVATDQWQFPVVAIFVLALVCTMAVLGSGIIAGADPPVRLSRPMTALGVMELLFGILAAVSTQFYDIENISVGSNFRSDDQARIFRTSGQIIATVLAVFTLAGILVRQSASPSTLTSLFAPLATPSIAGYILSPLAVAGCVAILFSSLDSVLVATTQMLVENGLRIVLSEASYRALKPTHARAAMAALAIVMCGSLIKIFASSPDFVPALLSVVYALTALAPMMASLVWLAANEKVSFIVNSRFVAAYLVGVLAFWVIAGVMATSMLKLTLLILSLLAMTAVCALGVLRGRAA